MKDEKQKIAKELEVLARALTANRISEEDRNNPQIMSTVNGYINGIKKEFEKGMDGEFFSVEYIKEKCDAIHNMAKYLTK